MTDAWPKHLATPKEEPPEAIPWATIEGHVRSRAILLKAIEQNGLNDAATLLSRDWSLPITANNLRDRIANTFNGNDTEYAGYLSEKYSPVPPFETASATTKLAFEQGANDPIEKWKYDPELNFVGRLLLADENVSPLQMVQILSRLGRTPTHPTLDVIKQFIGRNGGVRGASRVLGQYARPLPEERESELVKDSADLIRLTPQKQMSRWLEDERSRTLVAILLAHPKVEISLILTALQKYCKLPSVPKSAIQKPLARWKRTSFDPTENPRSSYAEALCRDCERNNPALYRAMIPIAREVAQNIPERVRERRRPEKIRRRRKKLDEIFQSFGHGQVVPPPLSAPSVKRLEYTPFSNIMEAIRNRRSLDTPHIKIRYTEQAYRLEQVVDQALLVPTVTIDFNLGGGSPDSKRATRQVLTLLNEELAVLKKHGGDAGSALFSAMLSCPPGRQPLLRFAWRDVSTGWKSEAAQKKLPPAEKAARLYQIPIAHIEALIPPENESVPNE